MKIVIDISDNIYDTIMSDVMPDEGQMSAIVTRIYQGTPYEGRTQGDLISRSSLLKAMEEERQYLLARGQTGAEHIIVHHCLPIIDNAPTVFDEKAYSDGYTQGTCDCEHAHERPQGEWMYDNILNNWKCSECGETPKTIGYVGTRLFMEQQFKFCNHCGADMRGGRE